MQMKNFQVYRKREMHGVLWEPKIEGGQAGLIGKFGIISLVFAFWENEKILEEECSRQENM